MYLRDITEIDGFDDLHQPEGLLGELQQHAAALYGAEESFYLVNGSTAGILSAISAAVPEGGHILMARNCHKSAYHAAYLRNLTVSYLYPPLLKGYDIFDGIFPEQVGEALEQEPDIGAVFLVSPTYEGRISDIRGIAEAVHGKNIPLIVDEAHGAHLGFAPDFAENSCRAGADLVIHSVHKTLPSLTQTALLHVTGNRIDKGLLRRFLHIYQSSSPSYLLMAGIDNALQYVEEAGAETFSTFAARYQRLLSDLAACKHLRFLPPERRRQDIGKLLISTKMTEMSGKQLYDILLEKYHLQLELAAETYALAMFTVNDAEEGYERLKAALLEIDGALGRNGACGRRHDFCEPTACVGAISSAEPDPCAEASGSAGTAACAGEILSVRQTACAESDPCVSAGACFSVETEIPGGLKLFSATAPAEFGSSADRVSLARAWDMEKRYIGLAESAGHYAGEFVNLYPPGAPLLVPGERITPQITADIQRCLEAGLNVQGLKTEEEEIRICVLNDRRVKH